MDSFSNCDMDKANKLALLETVLKENIELMLNDLKSIIVSKQSMNNDLVIDHISLFDEEIIPFVNMIYDERLKLSNVEHEMDLVIHNIKMNNHKRVREDDIEYFGRPYKKKKSSNRIEDKPCNVMLQNGIIAHNGYIDAIQCGNLNSRRVKHINLNVCADCFTLKKNFKCNVESCNKSVSFNSNGFLEYKCYFHSFELDDHYEEFKQCFKMLSNGIKCNNPTKKKIGGQNLPICSNCYIDIMNNKKCSKKRCHRNVALSQNGLIRKKCAKHCHDVFMKG